MKKTLHILWILLMAVGAMVPMSASAADIYVIGSNVNGKSWTLAAEDAKFTQTGPTTYEWTGTVLGTGFKFNDGTWSNYKMDWGGYNVTIGQQCPLVELGPNLALVDVNGTEVAEVKNPKIVLEWDGSGVPKITVHGESNGESKWYLCGINGNFDPYDTSGAIVLYPNKQNEYQLESDPFYISVPTGEFRISSTGWVKEYGTYSNSTISLDKMTATLADVRGDSGNVRYNLPIGSYVCRFNLNTRVVEFSTEINFVINGVIYLLMPNNGTANVLGYNNDLPRYLEIPSTVTYNNTTYEVTNIEDGAFANCTILEEVILPPTITSVASTAFSGCSNLKKCAYPNNIDNSFKAIIRLPISYPPNDVIIDNKVIYNSSKSKVLFGSIERSSVSIPNTVTSIDANAFSLCTNLNSISIPNTVTSIGWCAFSGCTNLTSVSLSNGLKTIEEYAFTWCSSLKSITVPNTVTSIGAWAFSECTNLTMINIPSSVNEIGESAFNRCVALTKVEIGDIVKWMQISFDNETANPLYNGKNLYLNGTKVTALTIPETIKEVKDYTFINCIDLKKLNIHQSVTKIGAKAFYGCSNLNTINSACSTPPVIYANTFSNYDATLWISAESENLYRNASYWRNFKNISISNRIYLSVLGFNGSITEKPMALLDESSVNGYTDWVNNLTLARNTLLYYTVDQAIDKMQNYNFGVKLANAVIITFTDGLDQGSLALKPGMETSINYAHYLSQKIKNTKIQDISLKAYTVGVGGNDVVDVDLFKANLDSLSSKPENVHYITNISQIDEKFDAIYQDLEMQKNQLILRLTVPMMENGATYRFTLDGVSNADASKIYVQGTYNSTYKRLDNLHYVGFTSVSGTSVAAVQNGIDLTYTFEDCRDMYGEILTLSGKNAIKEWAYIPSSGKWQPNSEMSDSDIDLEKRNTTALMLLIDCSSSLGTDDFSKLKYTANTFIERLIGYEGRYNGVEDIKVDDNDDSEIDWTNAEYYNMQGIRVMNPTSGFYIRRVGKHVQKVLLR